MKLSNRQSIFVFVLLPSILGNASRCEELAGMGFRVSAQHQTGNILTKQAAALLESIRDGTLELYKGDTGADLLVQDLYGVRVVEKSYGNKLEYAENENGHSDRLAAIARVLPASLKRLGQPLRRPAQPEYERVFTV